MGSLLEQTRSAHEDMENLERLGVKDFQQETKTHRERLAQSHRVRNNIMSISDRATKLRKIYEDKDGLRRDDIASMGGPDVFNTFYERMREVREYHKRYPNSSFTQKEDVSERLKEEPWVDFTGEESHGRYLDLHELYNEFVNSKFGRQMEYFEYLQVLAEFNSISRGLRMSRAYRSYLDQLFQLMQGFHQRTQPLTFLPQLMAKWETQFEEEWEAGTIEGWEDKGAGVTGYVDTVVDLDSYSSAEELLEAADMETIKLALQSLGMKVGGTPLQRAQRLFCTKGQALETLDAKLFVKGAAPVIHNEGSASIQVTKAKEVARAETLVIRLREILVEAVQNTVDNVEKKLTRTKEELEEEQEADEYVDVDGEEDEEEQIYNPLKLPLGWDGKPIPYWLYKLHGLNQEFKCEICGNYSYWGRRAYERHFREARHQHGMRCLGVPNTKAFLEVTQIEDAKRLGAFISTSKNSAWKPEEQEEFEDKDGNVYSRKTFTDLLRQGLV